MYLSEMSDDGLPRTPGSQSSKLDKYELATHTVKVRRTGALSDVMAIWDLPGDYVTIHSQHQLFTCDNCCPATTVC